MANRTVLFFVVLMLAAGGAGFVWISRQGVPERTIPVATPEAKAYSSKLKLANVEMKATESYVGAAVIEILGDITNNGDRELKQVDLTCIFHDPYDQVVLREPASIVRTKTGSLKPGETKRFRLPFDSIPESWNQRMPTLVMGQIVF